MEGLIRKEQQLASSLRKQHGIRTVSNLMFIRTGSPTGWQPIFLFLAEHRAKIQWITVRQSSRLHPSTPPLGFVASRDFLDQNHRLLHDLTGAATLEQESVTGWIDQLSEGDFQAAEQLWRHIGARLEDFARHKLDAQTRRCYDEHDAANSAFHSLCRGLSDGRIEAQDRDALWGLLAVITSRKISARRRYLNRLKRGKGAVSGESGFAELGEDGIYKVDGKQTPPDVLAEISESCAQLLNSLPDEKLKQIVLLKFQGATNGEVAIEMNCTRRTIERKLERIRRIWVEAGMHDGGQ